jgi:hypothetical protein
VSNNTISDLRSHLFDVIEGLKNPNKEARLDCQTADSICLAAKRLIETAEVEIKFRQVMGDKVKPSPFMTLPQKRLLRAVK